MILPILNGSSFHTWIGHFFLQVQKNVWQILDPRIWRIFPLHRLAWWFCGSYVATACSLSLYLHLYQRNLHVIEDFLMLDKILIICHQPEYKSTEDGFDVVSSNSSFFTSSERFWIEFSISGAHFSRSSSVNDLQFAI